MIKEIHIQSRASGKTTWALEKAEELNGFYVYGFKDCGKLASLPSKNKKAVVIDEPYYPYTLKFIIENIDRYDYYLIGTPTQPIQNINTDFYYILQTQFPEVLI